jgi:hypothetical protein
MSNTYRATTEAAEAAFSVGVFECDFTPAEERDRLDSGLLELVPRTYRVLSNNYAAGAQGDLVDLALLVEHESALVQGGHIERVDKPATTKKEK